MAEFFEDLARVFPSLQLIYASAAEAATKLRMPQNTRMASFRRTALLGRGFELKRY